MDRPNVPARTRAARAVRRSIVGLRHALSESSLIPGHTDYTRFVIVTSARTGSTLLTRSIGQNDKAIVYGEIMRREDLFPPRFGQLSDSDHLFREDPARFLEKCVYHKYPTKIVAVGFKMFYVHAPRDTQWGRAVWGYLAGRTDLRVIHLRRRNLLAALTSLKKAAETDQWVNYSGAAQQNALPLDFEDTRASFEQSMAWEKEFAELFVGHPTFDLYYEDLTADFSAQMGGVQEFLGLPVRDLTPATSKRPSPPLSRQIANYDELKSQFTGTPWAVFFEE
jgi:hypothetical protein